MIIKNGLVIDPASGLSEKMDLLIEDGIIKEMASLITKEGEEVLDAAGLVVAPGLIDTHVHFRDPGFTYKETIHTGALASAKGGFTSVICMANTSPTVDSVPVLKDNLSRASKEKIRIFQAASISCNLKGQEETDMDALKEAGACGFTDDGIPLLNAGQPSRRRSFFHPQQRNQPRKGIRCAWHLRFSFHCRRISGCKRLHAGTEIRRRCCDPAYQLRYLCRSGSYL